VVKSEIQPAPLLKCSKLTLLITLDFDKCLQCELVTWPHIAFLSLPIKFLLLSLSEAMLRLFYAIFCVLRYIIDKVSKNRGSCYSAKFGNADQLAANGVTVAGTRYPSYYCLLANKQLAT